MAMDLFFCSASRPVRQRWGMALHGAKQFQVIEQWDALELQLKNRSNPIILLHLSLPGFEAVDSFRQLHQAHPKARIIAFSDHPDHAEGTAYLKEGANGYCNTYIAPTLLEQVIEVVEMGEVWVGWDLMQELIIRLGGDQTNNMQCEALQRILTPREHEIATCIASGENNKQIASRYGISERTVKNHLSAIFRKTGVQDRLHLALLCRGGDSQ
ncbi:MAG: response regulator transcription factor [Candidatus Sedimenticola sp. (ex Thyasira tokunagai)]